MKKITIIKKDGESENYDESKVIRSLENSGASKEIIKEILIKLEKILYNNISTKEIFKYVFKELKKKENTASLKYNLKQGIINMTLGGGFVFEKFMGKVFQEIGYSARLNKLYKGKNITHEIDIVLNKNKICSMVECKHFSKPFLGVSIQTALYVYARFLDLEKYFQEVFLVTNTKFSEQVIDYSGGVGIKLIGWKYPLGNSLENLIENNKIYPITILPLSGKKIRYYLERNILTFQDLIKTKDLPQNIRKMIEKVLD